MLAFDSGITHFDLANNYGPPPGSAEENFGHILKKDFEGYRDEMIISAKQDINVGWPLWRMGIEEIFSGQPRPKPKKDEAGLCRYFLQPPPRPDTPLEETMGALDLMVRQGKALYVGISNYQAPRGRKSYTNS